MTKFIPALLLAAATLSAAPTSNVVFGNLGVDGLDGLDQTNTDITGTNKLAVGFNTGSTTSLHVTAIKIGAFVSATDNYTLSIYTGSGTAPNGSLVATSSLNLTSQDSGVWTFNFSNLTLSSNTTYWVLPEEGLSWYAPANTLTADELNASGYSFIGNRRSTNSGSTWSNYIVPYSLSIEAVAAPVPEPSTYGLALGGLALVGAVVARRRKQAK